MKTLRELRENSFSTLTTTVEEEKARTDMALEVRAFGQGGYMRSDMGVSGGDGSSPSVGLAGDCQGERGERRREEVTGGPRERAVSARGGGGGAERDHREAQGGAPGSAH